MSTCSGVMVRPATSQGVMVMRRREVPGLRPQQAQGEIFQEQAHPQGGDHRRDPGGLAQRAVGQAFDGHPQERGQQHAEGQGPGEDQNRGR